MTWADFLKRISLRPSFALTVELREPLTLRDSSQLIAMLRAPDIHTSKTQTVHHSWPVPDAPRDEREAFMLIRGVLRDVLLHELDECLLLDGIQVTDPHASR